MSVEMDNKTSESQGLQEASLIGALNLLPEPAHGWSSSQDQIIMNQLHKAPSATE